MTKTSLRRMIVDAMLVGTLVLAAALFGILTRPIGFLSAFWPANALLLGVLLTRPGLGNPLTFILAVVGFLAADLSTGSELGETLLLTAANMAGVLAGWFYLRRSPVNATALERPQAVYRLLQGAAVAAMAAAIVGLPVAPTMLSTSYVNGALFWFSSELVNYVLILPPVVLAPMVLKRLAERIRRVRNGGQWRAGNGAQSPWSPWPLLALVASTVAAYFVGGPGALAIPVPALLWCALSYDMFLTSVLTLVLCGWEMLAVTDGLINMGFEYDILALTTSLRSGIAMLAITPLILASVNTARNQLMRRLDRAASQDALTGVLARGALMERAAMLVRECAAQGTGTSLLMFDVDHFKCVNDGYGHVVGDEVLVAIAQCATATLRPQDLFGRFGREEFVVVLPGTDAEAAVAVAERLRLAVAESPIETSAGPVSISVSVGVASDRLGGDLDHLIAVADRALYRAKEGGRNRVDVGADQVPPAGTTEIGKLVA